MSDTLLQLSGLTGLHEHADWRQAENFKGVSACR